MIIGILVFSGPNTVNTSGTLPPSVTVYSVEENSMVVTEMRIRNCS